MKWYDWSQNFRSRKGINRTFGYELQHRPCFLFVKRNKCKNRRSRNFPITLFKVAYSKKLLPSESHVGDLSKGPPSSGFRKV